MPILKFVPLVILELLTFNAQKFMGSRDPGHAPFSPFRQNSSGVMSGLSLGASVPNLKFVPLVILKLLAFNTQIIKGSRDPGHALFSKKFPGVMSGLSLGACVPNLKFVSLTILELLAFNAQKVKGSHDPGHAPFSKKFFRVMSGLSLGACTPNLKFVSLVILSY